MRYLFILLYCLSSSSLAYQLNDGHIHYNQSIWHQLTAEDTVEYLSENNVDRAIVSSTPAEGTEKLYKIAPNRIIPFVRPYRTLKDVLTWHHNPAIVDYIKHKAASGIYQGFGEFHMWSEHLDGKSILPDIMQIAAEHHWALSAHTDIETIRALIEMQPTVTVMWAHCGFSYSAAEVQLLIEKYPTAYCEMSLNERFIDEGDNIVPAWKVLMEKHPDRFIVGIDTYKDARWGELQEHAEHIQEWLTQLHPDAAGKIANGNISRLFPIIKK